MNTEITELIKQVNPAQLVIIGGMFWFFYTRLKSDIKELKNDTDKRFDKIEDQLKSINLRIDKLYDFMLDLYKNLSRKDAA